MHTVIYKFNKVRPVFKLTCYVVLYIAPQSTLYYSLPCIF